VQTLVQTGKQANHRSPQQRGSATHFSRKPAESIDPIRRSSPHRNGWHFPLIVSASPAKFIRVATRSTDDSGTGRRWSVPPAKHSRDAVDGARGKVEGENWMLETTNASRHAGQRTVLPTNCGSTRSGFSHFGHRVATLVGPMSHRPCSAPAESGAPSRSLSTNWRMVGRIEKSNSTIETCAFANAPGAGQGDGGVSVNAASLIRS
jgi:hypothetical protein